ncbi:hypothetical protein B566_EDAN001330 [Ephemera danica]|nr:hypothetical protein B566_EDAN001330 [Ephemera danica]
MKLAAVEHMKRNPDCPLLKMQAHNIPLTMKAPPGPIPQRQAFVPPDVASIVPNLKHPLIESTSIHLSPLARIDVDEEYDYVQERFRFNFFKDYRGYVTVPFDLTRYGFHWCKGQDDTMKCSYCGLYVKNWQRGDLAAVVHTILSPSCPFMKSLYFIKDGGYDEID